VRRLMPASREYGVAAVHFRYQLNGPSVVGTVETRCTVDMARNSIESRVMSLSVSAAPLRTMQRNPVINNEVVCVRVYSGTCHRPAVCSCPVSDRVRSQSFRA
jgi:hypothetical protein